MFFLFWGSKEQLIERFKNDNKDFDDERATTEVTRFLMDAEMVNLYINYQKNPPDLNLDLEQKLDDPKTLLSYLSLFVVGGSIGYVNKNFIQPKMESGEFDGFHFPWQNANDAASEAATTLSGIFNAASDHIANV